MKSSIFSFVLFSFLLFLNSSCKGPEGPSGPTGPSGPSLTGDLIGYAYAYDVNNKADSSGIIVKAEGTTIIDTSASDGRWVLSKLSTGTYTIVFSKVGYGTTKSIGFQFVGGGQVYFGTKSIFQLPSFTITNLAASISGKTATISGSLSGSVPISSRYIRIFISTSQSVSSDPNNYIYNFPVTVATISTTLSTSVTTSTLNQYGIYTGQTIYVVAYAEGSGSGAYMDLSTGRNYYPSLNTTPSNIISIVVP